MTGSSLMPMALVTGGAGFIGSHVADHLLRLGHGVVVLDDLSGGFIDNVPPGATFVNGSILDEQLVERLFAKNEFSYVYHLAAYAAEGLSHFIKRFNYQNNLIGSVNLINASVNHGIKRFVFASSIAVYGAGQSPMKEDMSPAPEDPYGIAKLAVEQDLKSSHEMFGLEYTVFRPHNVYGERQNIGDKYRNVIGIFMNQCIQGEPMTIFGDGEQVRAFTYVGAIAPFIAKSVALRKTVNQTYNIGSDQAVSVHDLACMVAHEMNVSLNIINLPARREARVAVADHEKLLHAYGSRIHTPLKRG